MGRRRAFAAAAIGAAMTALLVLTGCASVYSQDEDTGNAKKLGESVEVEVQFNFLVFYERGPYRLKITPQEVVQATVGGSPTDCVRVDYEVLETPDGGPAEYATCTTAVNLLTEDYGEVEFGIWCSDDRGTQMDPRNADLEVGRTYTFYIPLVSSFGSSGTLSYLTVSDRSGFYTRSGTTYWYSYPE